MGCGSSSLATETKAATNVVGTKYASKTKTTDDPPTTKAIKHQNLGSTSETKTIDDRLRPKTANTKLYDEKFVDDALEAHNEFRKRHGSKPLKHAPDLTEYSQKWANHLVKLGTMKHSDCKLNGGKIGENIYYSWGSNGTKADGRDATSSWYSEIKDHDFSSKNFIYATGHFTQVVWAGSEEMGIAYAYSDDGNTVYVVANYRPAGNWEGSFLENVKPPLETNGTEQNPKTPQTNAIPSQENSGSTSETKTTDDKRQLKTAIPKLHDEKFVDDALQAHNEYRKRHGSKPLKHAPDLTEYSQKWANHLVKLGTMKHSDCKLNGGQIGENIYYSWGSNGTKADGRDATSSWYREIKDHDFSSKKFIYATGHFTQVVWAGSEEMGIAYAYSDDGNTVYVVANYRPAGNWEGSFLENVKPPLETNGTEQKPQETKAIPSQQNRGSTSETTTADDNRQLKTTTSYDETFVGDALQAHNEYRKKHGSQPLKHAPDLTEYSQKWANHLVKLGTMKHSDCKLNGGQIGENIYYSWGSHGTKADSRGATDAWYSEIKDHDFSSNNAVSGTGHFTQVVWSGSQEMGIAYAYSPDGNTVYVVANYRPAGNWQGSFRENVKPL